MKPFILLCSCLCLPLLVNNAGATLTTWDLQGTTSGNTNSSGFYTNSLSGTWENKDWSTSETGQATPTNWVENTAALFAVSSGPGTPAFTVTMNANHTVAGIFDGPLKPDPCTLTINGTGIITIGSPGGALFANLQGFNVTSDVGDPGSLTISNVIAGTLAGSGGFTPEGNGTLYLDATNTYASGTCLGFSGGSFGGSLYFNNSGSFGTAAIILSNCLGGALLAESSPMTITNPIILGNTTGQSLNIVPAATGIGNAITFTGNWTNNSTGAPLINTSSTAGNYVIISGVILGTGSFNVGDLGTMVLEGANTYSGATTIGAGTTLALSGAGSISNSGAMSIAAGGTFDVSALSSPYTLSSTNLSATGSNSAAATINGAASGVVNVGSQPISLSISPTSFNGESNQPALVISQASLTLSGNVITVSNASGTPLGAGNYILIQPNGGLTGTPSQYVVVTGAGLANGDYATVQAVGGNVFLAVVQPPNLNPTWNGNDYVNSPNWSDSTNWSSGVPDPTGDSVFFDNTGASQTPVMDSSYSVFALTFDGGCSSDILTASGANTLTIGSGVTNASGNPQTIAIPVQLVDLGGGFVASQWSTTGGNITNTSVISDNGIGLAVSGGNTLALNGVNTYTGGTTINGATLSANTVADAAGSIGTGPLTLEGGGSFAFTGVSGTTTRTVSVEGTTTVTMNVPTSSTLTFNGQVHSVSDTAAQMLTLTGGGTLNLGGTVDNSGLTMAINTGEVVITKTSASTAHGLGGGTTTVGTGTSGNSAELQLAGSGNNDLYSGCLVTVNSPDGFFDLNGQNDSFSTLTLSGTGPNGNGALINSSGTASSITNGGSAVVLAGATTIGGSGNIRLASAVSGAGMTLTYGGTGILTLGAKGTYTGGTTVNAGGTLQVVVGSPTNSSAGTGAITLNGNAVLDMSMTNTEMNNVITGGSTSVVNIAMGNGNLWLSNSTASQLTGFSGTYNVTTTAANGGQLVVGNSSNVVEQLNASATWQIGAGAVVDFNGFQTNPATVYLNGNVVSGQADGLLRLDASLQSGPVILMANSSIGNGNAVASTVSAPISGSFGWTKAGVNPLILTATNTYTGFTTISSGTLLLQGLGSINNSSSINIATGTTLDVSGLSSTTFSLSTSNSLSATGTSNNAAIIKGASGGTVNFGSQPVLLTFTPQTFTGDATNQALNISQGALQLGGNAVTVTNAGASPLGIGTYTLVNVAGGTITGTATLNGAVGGAGLAAGTAASLVVSGGALNLVVASAVVPRPTINAFSRSGNNLIMSGTNGPANGTYYVLTSSNVALPTTSWTPVSTNTFSPTGTFSVTNAISGSAGFFIIEIP